MSSRDKILEAVKKNQASSLPLPVIPALESEASDLVQKFVRALGNIGGTAIEVTDWAQITQHLTDRFSIESRWINTIPELGNLSAAAAFDKDPHKLENVTLSILEGHFGVAENGAVWITDDNMGDRALPFICEHLALVIHTKDIFPTLKGAYDHIGNSNYNFGTFIAGPSKTADIEQSLVLGAHGPKSLTVFLMVNG